VDFALWQREWLQGEELERQLGYWRERLAGAPEALRLPADFPPPARPTPAGGHVVLQVRGNVMERLQVRGADEFQALVIDVLITRRQVKEENDIIVAKALPTTKPRERANKPNEFKTNDDFCPGCGLELKSMPIERTNLWTDVFARDLVNGITTLISVGTNGHVGGNDNSLLATMSTNGLIGFESQAGNLTPNDTNGLSDVFVRNLLAGTTTLINGPSQWTISVASLSRTLRRRGVRRLCQHQRVYGS
jgi:hypothetical protein